MNNNILFTVLLSVLLASCGGTTSFNETARAGDTVVLPVGMQPGFNKDNITVTITPSTGPNIILPATDPTIRAVINFYPDPVSNMLVSRAIGEDTTPAAGTYADSLIGSAYNDKDWYQTIVFLDLPTSLPVGLTQVVVNNSQGDTHSVTLEIIPGSGVAHSFNSDFDGGLVLNPGIMDSLARANHTTVRISKTSGQPTPYAIEITLTHDADKTTGGTGKAFVINPLGYLKNLSWSDDGSNMKIIMMPGEGGNTIRLQDYKFYVAGTTTNLAFGTIKGYDINGIDVTATSGVAATLTINN